jgi:hypothetical protein
VNKPTSRRLSTAIVLLLLTTAGLACALLVLLGNEVPSDSLSLSPKHLLARLILLNLLFITYLFYRGGREQRLRDVWEGVLVRTVNRLRNRHDQMAGMLSLVRLEAEVPPDSVFDPLIQIFCYMFPCDQVSLMVADPDREYLELRSAAGHPDRGQILGRRQRVGHGIAGKVAAQGEPLLLGPKLDDEDYPRLKPRAYTISAAMVVPVLHRESLVGVLSVSSRAPGVSYSEDDLHMLQTFAKAASIHCFQAQQSLAAGGSVPPVLDAVHADASGPESRTGAA